MGLDVLPLDAIHVREGSAFWVDLLVRNALDAPVFKSAISSWALRVYDEGSQTPEIPIYSELARTNSATNEDGTEIWLAAVTLNGLSRSIKGHTFAEQFVDRYPIVGGKTYIHEYTFVLGSDAGTIVHRQQVQVHPTYQ